MFDLVEATQEGLHVVGHESEAMHAGVKLDVDGEGLGGVGIEGGKVVGEEVEYAEAVDVGLEVVADDIVEACGLGVHDHNGEGDAVATQLDTLVDVGHSEVVDVVELEGGGHLDGASTVGGSFDHGHEAGGGPQLGAEVVEVVNKGVEVDLHDGLMGLALEEFGDAFETEDTGTLEEDSLVAEGGHVVLGEEVVGGGVELAVDVGESLAAAHKGGTDTHEATYGPLGQELCHLGIEFAVLDSGLEDVAHNECAAEMLFLVGEVVEGDGEGVEIEGVAVVDEEAVAGAFVHLHTHFDGHEAGAAGGNDIGQIAEIEHQGDAVHDILLRGAINEGDGDVEGCGVLEVKGGVIVGYRDGEKAEVAVGGGAPCETA